MQVNLHGSTAPQSTTNFTSTSQPFTSAGSASTIMSQAEKSTDKGFLTTVLDAITFIPRKIWCLIQMLFCCNSTPVTVAGLLDNPDGFLRALAKDPVKGCEQLVDSILDDPAQLVVLFKIKSDPAASNALNAKFSMTKEETLTLRQKIAQALAGNMDLAEMGGVMAAGQQLPMNLVAPLTAGVKRILDTVARAVQAAPRGESRDMLEAFFAKNQDTLPAFLDTLPARIGQFQGLDAELPRVGPAAAARIERRSAALQAELRTDALKAILGIDAGEDVSLEDLALRLGSLQQKTLPLLLGVIMGALSTPTEEGIPGIQLDLKEQVAGILGDALGAAVLTLTEPLKEKSPAANIIHTRIEALLKDEKKLAAFITALLNTFMPSA